MYKGRESASHSWEQLQERLAYWLSEAPKPLGLMAANDARARHVLEACRRLGLRVPEDVALVGFDDAPLSRHLSPPLTTVRAPIAEAGAEATRQLGPDRHDAGNYRLPA